VLRAPDKPAIRENDMTRIPHRLATQVHDAAAELHHLAGGSLSVTANESQVGVGIARVWLRVERTGDHIGRLAASYIIRGEPGSRRKGGRPHCKRGVLDEFPARHIGIDVAHTFSR
jgi:hypothetical protein